MVQQFLIQNIKVCILYLKFRIIVYNFIAQIFGKPWNFGQFESVVLETALYLLNERTFVSVTTKGNPIILSRKLSALVSISNTCTNIDSELVETRG